MAVPATPYPASLTFQPPETIDRWRPLVQWFLAIPHYVVLYFLGIVAEVLGVVSWFWILFTGKLPEGIAGIQIAILRWNSRVHSYAGFLQDSYPPFAFVSDSADPGNYDGLRVDFQPALTDRNRLTTFFRLLLAIPHMVVLFVLFIALWFVMIIAFFAVLFTTRWPVGLRDFVVGVMRWNVRFSAYLFLLTDEYPPFSLD